MMQSQPWVIRVGVRLENLYEGLEVDWSYVCSRIERIESQGPVVGMRGGFRNEGEGSLIAEPLKVIRVFH